MTTFTIGQLAKQAEVNIETIRYYERRNLIPEPPRLESGYRQYSPDFVARIRFIKRAQDLGFSLNEVSELLALRVQPDSACHQVQKQAIAKITDIDAKIELLQSMRTVLNDLVRACDENTPTANCPILSVLDANST